MTAADYLKASRALAKAEADLTAALDRLAAAREAGDAERVTPARVRAQAAARVAEAAADIAFQAHKAYWRAQAQDAERRLIAAVTPHLAEVDALHRAAGSLVPQPALRLIEHLFVVPLPAFAPEVGDVPIVFPDSDALDRSENEILAWQPGWKMPPRRPKP